MRYLEFEIVDNSAENKALSITPDFVRGASNEYSLS